MITNTTNNQLQPYTQEPGHSNVTATVKSAPEKKKRKPPSSKKKLQVFKRDNYSCQICGKSPALQHGLSLEVDHIQPFSKGGADELSNYQTLCIDCNRGKGNDTLLNRTAKEYIDTILNQINPLILENLNKTERVSVVANQEEYKKLIEKNNHKNFYNIEPSTNTLIGFGAGKRLGIYTIQDSGGSKVHFYIKKLNEQP